ncbi:MAG: hypothetical protein ACE361_14440 [Aureliella sp.]
MGSEAPGADARAADVLLALFLHENDAFQAAKNPVALCEALAEKYPATGL